MSGIIIQRVRDLTKKQDVVKPVEMPKKGLSLNFLIDFLTSHEFEDMYACEQYVLNMTRAAQCSLADLIQNDSKVLGAVTHTAKHYVSFPYGISVKELLSALEEFRRASNQSDLSLWISVFSLNLHTSAHSGEDTHFLTQNIPKLIAGVDSTLFVLDSWTQPSALARLWCAFEFYVSLKSGIQLEFCISGENKRQLLKTILADLDTTVENIGNANTAAAETSQESTSQAITTYFQQSNIGFEAINEAFRENLRRWFTAQLDDQLQAQQHTLTQTEQAHMLNTVGILHFEQKDMRKAEACLKENVKIRFAVFGKESPEYAIALYNLGWLYMEQERFDEAEDLYKKAIKKWKSAFGETCKYVASGLNNLGHLYHLQRRFDDAEKHMLKALEIDREFYQGLHPALCPDLRNLAELYKDQGEYAKAASYLRRAVHIYRGEDQTGIELAADLISLAEVFQAQGQVEEAERTYKEALQIDREAYGASHPQVASDLNDIAALYKVKRSYDAAEKALREALEIDREYFGSSHATIARDLNNLAEVLLQQVSHLSFKTPANSYVRRS